MLINKNVSLKPYNTFGLESMADTMIHVRTEKEAKALFNGELSWKKPMLILGGGSNILFTGDFSGTILCPAFSRIKFEEYKDEHVIVSAGAGVEWDKLVEWTVRMGFSGLENLSGIPGNVGAVPVQNIGAYGSEVKDFITKVRTISTTDGKVRIFSNDECHFGYRTSVFKNSEKGKYLLTRVYFKLDLNFKPNLNYGSLNEEVGRLGQSTLRNVRIAVINIRQRKLPDPKVIGNAGSFFKNPIVIRSVAEKLLKAYPGLPLYDDPSGNKKLAAGWMIEQCGCKGWRIRDAGVHEKQALVLVNHGNATGKDIFDLSEKIRISVKEKFGVTLDGEVEVVGTV